MAPERAAAVCSLSEKCQWCYAVLAGAVVIEKVFAIRFSAKV
jgi:hypothetical protein